MLSSAPGSPWLPKERRLPPPDAGCPPVLCFPPAGAGAGFFRAWAAALPRHWIVPVQLPGREERFAEPAMDDTRQIAANIGAAVAAQAWSGVTMLGYSYGALLAFETAHFLEQRRIRVHGLVACARAAPQSRARTSIAALSDDALLSYVQSLDGLPPEILAEPEFLALLLPVLRADFSANDLYAEPTNRRIRAPIVHVAGKQDPATAGGQAAAWQERTLTEFRSVSVDGGHFFIHEHGDVTFRKIDEALTWSLSTQKNAA